jgi:hypothetical protein
MSEITDQLLQNTVDTIIDLDEPEQIIPTLRKAAERRRGERWRRLALVLAEAEVRLDQLANAKPAGPDFRLPSDEAVNTDAEAKSA